MRTTTKGRICVYPPLVYRLLKRDRIQLKLAKPRLDGWFLSLPSQACSFSSSSFVVVCLVQLFQPYNDDVMDQGIQWVRYRHHQDVDRHIAQQSILA